MFFDILQTICTCGMQLRDTHYVMFMGDELHHHKKNPLESTKTANGQGQIQVSLCGWSTLGSLWGRLENRSTPVVCLSLAKRGSPGEGH